jgi:Co/Zn/Cd efflux system component
LFGSSKREKSPIAATIEIPAIASTPGIVINRATAGSDSASTASSLSTIYGYGRAEDLAGLFVIAVITLSAVLAAWEAIDRLIHPRDVHNVWAVAGAAVIGFAGNELVAPLPHPRRAAHRLGGPGR